MSFDAEYLKLVQDYLIADKLTVLDICYDVIIKIITITLSSVRLIEICYIQVLQSRIIALFQRLSETSLSFWLILSCV
jgi:hypothetical protein